MQLEYPTNLDQPLTVADAVIVQQVAAALIAVGKKMQLAVTYRDLKEANELMDRSLPADGHLA